MRPGSPFPAAIEDIDHVDTARAVGAVDVPVTRVVGHPGAGGTARGPARPSSSQKPDTRPTGLDWVLGMELGVRDGLLYAWVDGEPLLPGKLYCYLKAVAEQSALRAEAEARQRSAVERLAEAEARRADAEAWRADAEARQRAELERQLAKLKAELDRLRQH